MKFWYALIIIVIIVIGFYSYKLIPFNYTPNIPPLLAISNGELNALDEKLKNKDLTEKEKQEIYNRQEEIYSLLEQFFGKDVRELRLN